MAMTHKTLTETQREVLQFIYDGVLRSGAQPSVREIGTRFQIRSPNGVMCHIRALERKGYVGFYNRNARSLKLLRLPDGSPFCGFAIRRLEDAVPSLQSKVRTHAGLPEEAGEEGWEEVQRVRAAGGEGPVRLLPGTDPSDIAVEQGAEVASG